MHINTNNRLQGELKEFVSSFLHTGRIILRNLLQRKYEPEIAHLGRFLNPGDICLHIGASDGRHTVVMSRLIGDGVIHCFEPSIYTLTILKRVLNFHKIKNVKTYNLAMSDQVGKTYLEPISELLRLPIRR